MKGRNIKEWIEKRKLIETQKLELLSKSNIKKYKFSKNEIVEITTTFEKDISRKKIIARAKELGLTQLQVCQIAKGFLYEKSKKEFIEQKSKEGYTPTYLVKVIESFKYDKSKLEYIIGDEENRATYGMQMNKIINSLKTEKGKQSVIEQAEKIGLEVEDIVSIIANFKLDSNKKKYLSETQIQKNMLNGANLTKIIMSMKDDEAKKEILNSDFVSKHKLKKINIRNILLSIESDKIKINYINKNTFKLPVLSQVKVISSVKNNDVKLKILKQIKNLHINKSTKIASEIKLLLSIDNEKDPTQTLKNIESIDKEMSDYKETIMFGKFQELEQFSKGEISSMKECMGIDDNIKIPKIPKDMKIGIELEAIGKDDKGTNNAILLKKIRNLIGGYTAKNDTSLKGHNNSEGVEIVSPVLSNNDLETIPIITELMKRSGLETNSTCGGHIHIGADYLDTVEAARNFIELYIQNEKIFYKIANPAGQKIRRGIKVYAKPLYNKFNLGKSIELKSEDDLNTFIEKVKGIEKNTNGRLDRYHGLNLTNLNNYSKNTYEFRIFNGTLDSKEIFNNIKLCSRMMEVAKQLGDIEIAVKQGRKITKKQRELLNKKNYLMTKFDDERKYANEFINLLFEDKEDREIFRERYEKAPKREIDEIFNKRQNKVGNNRPRREIRGISRFFKKKAFNKKRKEATDLIEEYLR